MDSHDNDRYEAYAQMVEPRWSDRQARRARKAKGRHAPRKQEQAIVAELADTTPLEDRIFTTSYQPSRYEAEWLLESLKPFYQQEYISDVQALVKGGKEASVYRCQARSGMDAEWLAAKVYRPRKFRQLRNDKVYREGRVMLTPEGHVVKENNQRTMRALEKKTAFGAGLEHMSWLMHEFTTLQRLYDLGAAVPKPYAAGENAILMSYIGDDTMAGPPLRHVRLDRGEAHDLYHEVLRNIELMLINGIIHGDLSAYNILYWEGRITLIDFPQVVGAHTNSQAFAILRRDIERVCTYFASYGIANDPEAIFQQLWKRFVEPDPALAAADLSRIFEQPGMLAE